MMCDVAKLLLLALLWPSFGVFVNAIDGVADSVIVNPDLKPSGFDPIDNEVDMILVGDELERNAMRSSRARWPNGVIPYKINKLGAAEKQALLDAIDDYSKYTCIKWEPYSSSKHGRKADYVEFINGNGCYSYVGRSTDRYRQPISLGIGCAAKGIAIHEMMHAIGFFHEQSRGDRDKFVKINYRNVKRNYENQFEKLRRREEDNLGMGYDYNSVMHYGRTAFALNKNIDTITPLFGNPQIGQRLGFSSTDIEKINKLYDCPKYIPPDTTSSRELTSAKTSTKPSTKPDLQKVPVTKKTVQITDQPVSETQKPVTTSLPKKPVEITEQIFTDKSTQNPTRTPPTEKQPEEKVCEDTKSYRYCRLKLIWNHCKRNEKVRLKECQKTCSACSETLQQGEEECVDRMDTCKLGYNCYVYGKTECRKSCGNCEAETEKTQVDSKKQKKSTWWGLK